MKCIAATAVLVMVFGAIAVWSPRSPNRVTISNASGRDVQSVTLTLKSLDGNWSITRRFALLRARHRTHFRLFRVFRGRCRYQDTPFPFFAPFVVKPFCFSLFPPCSASDLL